MGECSEQLIIHKRSFYSYWKWSVLYLGHLLHLALKGKLTIDIHNLWGLGSLKIGQVIFIFSFFHKRQSNKS